MSSTTFRATWRRPPSFGIVLDFHLISYLCLRGCLDLIILIFTTSPCIARVKGFISCVTKNSVQDVRSNQGRMSPNINAAIGRAM